MPRLSTATALACGLSILACEQVADEGPSRLSAARVTFAGAERSAQSGAIIEPSIDWPSAGRDARVMHMTFEVLVPMAELFQSFDKERYVNFTCTTCHGEDMVEVDFKMPNTLYPLDPDDLPRPDSHNPREAAYAQFMSEAVAPKMGALLGDQSFGDADGCWRCHATR